MPLPFTTLNAAVSVGAGTSKDLEGVYENHLMGVFVNGSGQIDIALQGSHDGLNWFQIGEKRVSGSDCIQALGYPVRYVRGNFLDIASGSVSFVTATIASS